VVTPNAFELAYLATGGDPAAVSVESVSTLDGLLAAVDAVRATGPSTVLVTSVPASDAEIGMLATDSAGSYLVTTPRLPLSVNGLGDVTAALFLAHLADGLAVALARVASSVYGILAATDLAGSREICLVQAQSAIATPACEFAVQRIG
jgi:pyridoxine kinase